MGVSTVNVTDLWFYVAMAYGGTLWVLGLIPFVVWLGLLGWLVVDSCILVFANRRTEKRKRE